MIYAISRAIIRIRIDITAEVVDIIVTFILVRFSKASAAKEQKTEVKMIFDQSLLIHVMVFDSGSNKLCMKKIITGRTVG